MEDNYSLSLSFFTFVLAWISATLTTGSRVRSWLFCWFILPFIHTMASLSCLSTRVTSSSSKWLYCSSYRGERCAQVEWPWASEDRLRRDGLKVTLALNASTTFMKSWICLPSSSKALGLSTDSLYLSTIGWPIFYRTEQQQVSVEVKKMCFQWLCGRLCMRNYQTEKKENYKSISEHKDRGLFSSSLLLEEKKKKVNDKTQKSLSTWRIKLGFSRIIWQRRFDDWICRH